MCVLFAGGNESGLAKTDGDTQLSWEDFSSFFGGWRWRGFIDDKQWQKYAKNADTQQCTIELKQHNCCTWLLWIFPSFLFGCFVYFCCTTLGCETPSSWKQWNPWRFGLGSSTGSERWWRHCIQRIRRNIHPGYWIFPIILNGTCGYPWEEYPEYPKFVPPCTHYVWEYLGNNLLKLVFEECPHVPFDINSANV